MPDPTLTDHPELEWTLNEVLKVLASDLVEGAATGASYSGIGRSNQQAQQLANRTAFLKQRQDINITNIATLLTWMGLFGNAAGVSPYVRSELNPNSGNAATSWLTIGVPSTLIKIMAEWIDGPSASLTPGEQITFTLLKAFAAQNLYAIYPMNGCVLVSQTSASVFTIKNGLAVATQAKVVCLGVAP